MTSGVQNTFPVGGHTVSETPQPGYTSAITGACAADRTVTLNPGDVKSCTITNDDVPRYKIMVLVCRENDTTLYSSNVTIDNTPQPSLSLQSLAQLTGMTPESLMVLQQFLCGLPGGSDAIFGGRDTGSYGLTVDIQ